MNKKEENAISTDIISHVSQIISFFLLMPVIIFVDCVFAQKHAILSGTN